MKKIPAITALFWVMKICATTLGETAGDLFSMTMHIGYTVSSAVLLAVFFATLSSQLYSRKYSPILYWLVILSTSTAGTTMSDYMDRTLGVGYAMGSFILVAILCSTLLVWRLTEKSISVTDITTRRGELFYWTAILFSNTLGTALGDYLADNSGLGFAGGAMLIGGVLAVVLLAHYFTKLSPILLFWIAFVLTRPFGATFGDLLTKTREHGGLGFGTQGSSLILISVLVVLIVYATIANKRTPLQSTQ
ncbi:membrane protein [soil metagenome]